MRQPNHLTPGATFAVAQNPRFLASSRGFRATAADGYPTLARRRALAPAFDLIDELGMLELAGEQLAPAAADQVPERATAEPERVSEAPA